MGSYGTYKYPAVAEQVNPEDSECKNCESASKMVMASHGVAREQEDVGLLKLVIAQEIQISSLCKQVAAQEHQISVLSKQVAFLRLGFKRAHDIGDIPTSHFDGVFKAEIYESETSKWSYTRAVHRCVLVTKSRVLKSRLDKKMSNTFCLPLPTLRFREFRDKSVKDNNVFDAFVDYLYLATVSGPRLRVMWRDLLQLATEFEIAALKEECEQFVERSVDINRYNILEILEVGWSCTSEPVLRCALTKSFEDPKAPLLNLNDATYKELVEDIPDLNDRVIQAEESANSRRGTILIDNSKSFTKDSMDSTSLFLQIVTLCSGGRNFLTWRPKRRVSSSYKL